MGKPKLSLYAPAEHTILLTSASNTTLAGQLSYSNIPSQCDVRVILVRVGRLMESKETKNGTVSRNFMAELGFMGPQKEQKRKQLDYDTAEKLTECLINSISATGSKTTKCDFNLPIPSYLPATAALPSVEISYALFATCTLPNGTILQSSQNLRIIRKNAELLRLEPSRTVSFPESPLAIRASFDTPILGSKNICIPTTLQLSGLSLKSTGSMRPNERRWLVPREIKWEFEETAVLISEFPDGTGHIPMSTAQRVLKKRNLSTGKEKLKLKYPFTRPGNTFIRMMEGTGMEIPFNVTAPKGTHLGDTTTLSVAGGHILHTVQSSEASPKPELPQRRFAVYLEYKLRIWLRIGEDVFDEASGDLVNRKMDEMAYTVLCPLTTQHDDQSERSGTPPPMVPPAYDGEWETSPPDYMDYSSE
jgi:hypothetical protein